MNALRTLLIVAIVLPSFSAQEIDFARQVQPILEKSCIKCHGPKRQKGDLRLDQWSDALTKGEEPTITAGHPEKSALIGRVTLDPDDPDFMPQSGDPLTREEIAILAAWVKQGAKWPEGAAEDPDAHWNSQFAIPALSDAEKARQAKAIDAVRKIGGLANRIAQNTAAVDVNLSLLGDEVDDEKLAALSGLESSLVWLNLSRTGVTDAGMKAVGAHKHLRRLHLAKTRIGDAGVKALAGLEGLRYLNLYGTNVTDAGLAALSGMKELEKVFLWQTKVTQAGVDKLQAALPKVIIDQGKYKKPKVVAVETKPMAKAVNEKCPITGKPVDGAITVKYQEQLVAVCCNDCKAAFEKDPKKFIDKVDGFKHEPVNVKCPVTGKPVDAAHTSKLDGKVVAFCCPNCKKAFDKDPKKFAAKLK